MSVISRKSRRRLAHSLLIAVVLLVAQTTVTHALEHDLAHHDGLCALFLHANQLGDTPLSHAPSIAVIQIRAFVSVSARRLFTQRPIRAYASRAPPLLHA